MPRYPYFKERYGKEAIFSLTITLENVQQWNSTLELEQTFVEKYANLFMDCVFQAHKYLIRITPFDTGRLRGGWTSFLDNKRIDYAADFQDTSLIGHKVPQNLPEAIEEGKALSSFQEKPLDVLLTNAVNYAQYVEFGTSMMAARNYTAIALYKAEWIFTKAIMSWSTQCAKVGKIVDYKPLSEAMV